MLYECNYHNTDGRYKHWQGYITLISASGDAYEAIISGESSSFHIIVGKHKYGSFLCIPSHGIGCELSDLGDTFWNIEQLSRRLSDLDAVTVVKGISYLPELTRPTKGI